MQYGTSEHTHLLWADAVCINQKADLGKHIEVTKSDGEDQRSHLPRLAQAWQKFPNFRYR
jgi:hypothetical protein